MEEKILKDGGQIYTETNLDQFIVEPFNAATALIFLGIVIYWWYTLKGEYSKYPFLTFNVALLFVGGVGGTLYHAFRSHNIFLKMDWIPILILCVAAGIYFFVKILKKWWLIFPIFALLVTFQFFNYMVLNRFFADNTIVTINYAILGMFILVPLMVWMSRTKFIRSKYVFFSLCCFGLALFFRVVDPMALMPIGTHWLWHVFGAMACHFLMLYVYHMTSKYEVFIKLGLKKT